MSFSTLICLAIVALLAVATSAAPHAIRTSPTRSFISDLKKSDRTFSFKSAKNSNFKLRYISPTVAYATPFLKHNMTMPAPLKKAYQELKTNGSTGSLSSRVVGNVIPDTYGFYVYPITIGTPAQTMNMMFDTGSADLWVWSWLMPASSLVGRNYYNATASSSSAEWTGQWFYDGYGSGWAEGNVWQDTIWINAGNANYGIGGNPIEVSTQLSSVLLDVSFSGIDGFVGLDWNFYDSERPNAQQTYITYLLDNLASPVFTMNMVQNSISTVNFGYIDTTKYIGSIAYTSLITISGLENGMWSVSLTGYQVANQPFNNTIVQLFTDTGGNFGNMPASMCARYFAQVRGSFTLSDGSWAFPCSSTLPNLYLGVGAQRITIHGKYFNNSVLSGGVNCWSSVQPNSENGYIYFSMPFLASVFMVYDYGNLRLGFANRTEY